MPKLQSLIDGYRRFRTGPYQEQRLRFDRLAQGQSPKVMVIACSDSRVDPSRVFDTEPGEMFVMRNIANLVPPIRAIEGQSSVAAGLEYAILVLKVHYIVVFGHARCGGIKAALSPKFGTAAPGEGLYIDRWMEMIEPARRQVLSACALSPDVDAERALEQSGIRLSLDNLRSYPFVVNAEKAGAVKLVGAIFDIADGCLKLLDSATGQFVPVTVELDG